MSFSVSAESGFEYSGSSLTHCLPRRSNLLRPAYWRMLRDILRFNRDALRDLAADNLPETMTLDEYLARGNYSRQFRDWYLIPMGAAIWSSGTQGMRKFPAKFFVRFFRNHGLLSLDNRPQWRTIRGGSRSYLAPLCKPFAHAIRAGDPVVRVRRDENKVTVNTRAGAMQEHDVLVLACHSNQALAMLDTPSNAERTTLGALPYRDNDAVLHTDTRLLPRRPRARASWNYRLTGSDTDLPVLTYDMTRLQQLPSRAYILRHAECHR